MADKPREIPEPTRDDLLRLAHADERAHLESDVPAKDKVQLWESLKKRYYDGQRTELTAANSDIQHQQKGSPATGSKLSTVIRNTKTAKSRMDRMERGKNRVEELRELGEALQPRESTNRNIQAQQKASISEPKKERGTRVIGQTASESEHERQQREQRLAESEVVATMYATHREKYNNPNTPEDQRKAIFQTYKDKLEERKHREEAEFRKKLARIVEAQDWLRTIKDDPEKAHIELPADDSEEELLKWHNKMSQPVQTVPHLGSIDAGAGTQSYNRPDLRQLQSEVDRATKVMGEAAKILRPKSAPDVPHTPTAREPHPQTATVAPKEKVSWIHRIPVWKEFGHWLKWASASFAFAATMAQLNEYLLAELGLFICGICCLAQIYVWTTRKRNVAAKLALALLSVGFIGVAGLTVYKIKGNKLWTNWLEVNTPTGKVQIKNGETVTARIKQWGTSAEHDAFVIVNSIELAPLADDYRLTVICRAQDNKLDAREDLRIDKSAMFTISGSDQRLEVALSQDTMTRLVPQGFINIYVLLVPAKVNAKELRTIKEFTQNGAYVMGNPSMLVHATVENKSGRFAGN